MYEREIIREREENEREYCDQDRERNSKLHNFDTLDNQMGKIHALKIVLMMVQYICNKFRERERE